MSKRIFIGWSLTALSAVGCAANGGSDGSTENLMTTGVGGASTTAAGGAGVSAGGYAPLSGQGGFVAQGSGGSPSFGSGGASAPSGAGGLPPAGFGGSSFGSGGAFDPLGRSGGPGMGGSFGESGMGGSFGEPGMGGGTGEAGAPDPGDNSQPTKLPSGAPNCPPFRNGATVQIPPIRQETGARPMNAVVYIDAAAKSKPAPGGPLIFYYHATLGNPGEVLSGFGLSNIQKVTSMGGVVVSFQTTGCTGCATTDDFYWYTQDNLNQDTAVACAIEQANIDTRHIHALGWSAGALHATYVGLSRSDYMASIISYSGGVSPWPLQNVPQDPNNHVSAVMTYGSALDSVVINFPTQSRAYYDQFSSKGYYTLMCFHNRGHEIDGQVAPHSLDFFMAHPYRVNPAPWASSGPPAGWPAYCKNTPG